MTSSSHPNDGKAVQPARQKSGGQDGAAPQPRTNRPFPDKPALVNDRPQNASGDAEAAPRPRPEAGQQDLARQQRAARVKEEQAKAQQAKAKRAQALALRQQNQPIPVRPMNKPAAHPAAQALPAGAAPPQQAIPVRPTVSSAYPRRRHWLLLISFIVIVLLPAAIWGWYLWVRASDQYVSTVGFSVRKEEATPAIDLLGGLAPLAGSTGASDTDILYEYIRSQDMVEKIDEKLDLRGMFSREWPRDFVFAADPEDHIEDLTEYWQRQVKVLHDSSSDLITLKVSAFTPEDAQRIAAAVFEESSSKINDLSAIAREDTTRLTRAELDKAREELTRTRQAMTAFRMQSQIVDPEADLAGQMGVLSGLQAQLAEALVAHDLLVENARPTDQRVIQSQQKIDALRRLIEAERSKFGAAGQGPSGESYAQLMAEYEKLAVDREFAEGAYRAARVSYEAALAEAQRKSRYLAAHIEPKVAQSATEPDRLWLFLMVTGMLLTGWSILALIYYSIRDRR
ncbi:capsular polysaccharide transport system permease protein [Paracoccus halophilus]|uniref:Capsular polysaccharide transport system permease protein n=1 Tax=Paracoccus halophilus TaxID=376733 RepID=A0A099F803_9RHOB|nr:capsule biosynthesis protein [Paracoccus halophilus]KGJ06614.1 capsule biosynthesis protein [Paracoccus halophilus]SFA42692.1 capsular polysaccharide transport system permease protein [Paracoccus halophilus]